MLSGGMSSEAQLHICLGVCNIIAYAPVYFIP